MKQPKRTKLTKYRKNTVCLSLIFIEIGYHKTTKETGDSKHFGIFLTEDVRNIWQKIAKSWNANRHPDQSATAADNTQQSKQLLKAS